MDEDSNILILGGGPAGMACAMELHKAKKNVTIIEKAGSIGGLSRTLEFKEDVGVFRTDIGPHRFFSKNKYLYDFVEELLKDDWILVPRQTRQLIEGKFYDYPINALQAFKNIGPTRSVGMGLSYAAAVVNYKLLKKEITHFEDYIVSNFGQKLGRFNMLNYTEKIWGMECSKLHPDWARQRIKGLNLVSALKNTLSKERKNSPKSLVDQFYYPKFGTGLIYDTIAKKITEGGSTINLNSTPSKIVVENDAIKEVRLTVNGSTTCVSPEKIVSSIPITELITLLDPKPPKKVHEAAKKLKWRGQVYLFLTLNKERVTKDNWIYFPNKEIPFGRVAEMKNFSEEMSPKGKTSLFVEFFVTQGDKVWNMDKEQLLSVSLKHLDNLNLVSRKDVRNAYVFKKSHVYPVYDLEYPENLAVIKEYLNKITNLNYIGRPGRFQYTNQDHSLEMGILAARNILDGKNYDYDKIGSENEYFEKGHLQK